MTAYAASTTALMTQLGMGLGARETKLFLAELDPNGDGRVDFDEFAAVMANGMKEKAPEELAADIFQLLDTDKSGHVDLEEMAAKMRMTAPDLTEADLNTMMQLFDKDNSGQIYKHEFVQAIVTMKTFDRQ